MKKVVSYFLNNTWLRALVLLILYLVLGLQHFFRPDSTSPTDFRMVILIIGSFIWFFINNRVLIDRLLLKKKYLLYFLFFSLGIVYYANLFAFAFNPPDLSQHWVTYYVSSLFYTTFWAICYFAFKYLKDMQNNLRNELMVLELEQKHIKSQMNPHFLFNALNNIYSYSIHKPELSGELILRLSELMRYILDVSKKSKVPISEELKFISNYISFEQERLIERCTINFNMQIHDSNRHIEPLLFFPFIENAFKHGTNTTQHTTINIDIKEDNKFLILGVENDITQPIEDSPKTGIENAVKRLKFLYKDKYHLTNGITGGKYKVDLKIEWDDKI